MSVSSELNTVLTLATLGLAQGVYDTKLPDGYVLGSPAVVIQLISDIAEIAIDGPVVQREARWQVSVIALDLVSLRPVKDAVIAAVHGYAGGAIARADFAGINGTHTLPGEAFDSKTVPFRYHSAIDFLIQF